MIITQNQTHNLDFILKSSGNEQDYQGMPQTVLDSRYFRKCCKCMFVI